MSQSRERGVEPRRRRRGERQDKWSSSRGAMEINEGWSKNGVSHARISAHVLHIVQYPAAADPSPLKRDRCVCVRARVCVHE